MKNSSFRVLDTIYLIPNFYFSTKKGKIRTVLNFPKPQINIITKCNNVTKILNVYYNFIKTLDNKEKKNKIVI